MLATGLLSLIAIIAIGCMLQANAVTAIGLGMAAIVPMASIDDVPDIDVAGEALSYRIGLIRLADIDRTKKFEADTENPGAIKSVPLLEAAKMAYIDCHAIPEFNSKGSKGDITVSGTNTLTAVVGGFRDETLRLVEQYVGGKFLVIVEECGEKSPKYLLGTVCKPMVLKEFDLRNNKDSRSLSLTFENKSIYQPKTYTGVIGEAVVGG